MQPVSRLKTEKAECIVPRSDNPPMCTRQSRRQSESAACWLSAQSAVSQRLEACRGAQKPSDLVPNTATDWLSVRTWTTTTTTTTTMVVVPCCSCQLLSPLGPLCSLSRVGCCASSTSCQDTRLLTLLWPPSRAPVHRLDTFPRTRIIGQLQHDSVKRSTCVSLQIAACKIFFDVLQLPANVIFRRAY